MWVESSGSEYARRLTALAAAVGVVFSLEMAQAQTDEQRADARAAAEQGAQAFEAGKWAEAIDLFTRAESLVHAPPHLLFMARAQVKLGQLVRARESYKKIVREKLSDASPAAFLSAQQDATTELAQLEPRIPTLKIVVKGGEGRNVKVTLDGAELSSAVIGIAKPVDPGNHEIVASAEGMTSAPKNIQIAEAARESVELELVPSGAAPAVAPGGQTEEPAAQQDPTGDAGAEASGGNGLRIASYVALGVGVVGLGAGTFFALQSSSKRKDADALCEGGCPVAKRGEIDGLYDDAGKAQTLSMVSFIVGGVGVASGVTLFVLSGKKKEPAAAHVQPWIGVGSLGMRGRF